MDFSNWDSSLCNVNNIFDLDFLASAAVLESVGTYKVSVIRHGKMDHVAKVR